ncbi:hypothetical protein TNCV_4329291 [Trichonephila clavipes]|nr:hypothetical protein TNCV_4329291 [Trichonephila clavipes]
MVPRITTRGVRVLALAAHTIASAVVVVAVKAKAGLRRSPHTNTIVITAEIESGLVAKDDLVPFHCSAVSSCVAPLQTRRRRWVDVKGSTRNGRRDPNVFQPGAFVWFGKTQAPREGATCACVAADE